MLDAQMSDALETLDEAIARRDKSDVRQATIGVALASLDFELRHEERSEIDLDLIEVWLRQLVIDAQARDRAGVRGDLATIRWIRDRLGSEAGRPIDRFLGDPAAAEGAADVDSLAETAENLRQELSAGRRSAR
jgi:hypothetical protein